MRRASLFVILGLSGGALAACTLSTAGSAPDNAGTTSAVAASSAGVGGAMTTSASSGTSGGGAAMSASAASSTAMSSSSSGSCVPLVEDCNNGVDDDCDGKADCLDSDCICMDAANLMGVEALAAPDDGKGNCSGEFADFGYAECEACQCNAIAHGQCEVHVWLQQNDCNPNGATDLGAQTGCQPVNNGHFRVWGAIDMTSMPSCTAKAPLTAEIGLCTAAVPTKQSNCAMNQVCAPAHLKKPPCLAFDGDVVCPMGFTTKQSAYATAAPGQCSCDCSPNGDTCPTNMTFKLSPNMNCSMASPPLAADGTCDNYLSVPVAVQYPAAAPTAGGSCDLDAQPNGASAAKTICCAP